MIPKRSIFIAALALVAGVLIWKQAVLRSTTVPSAAPETVAHSTPASLAFRWDDPGIACYEVTHRVGFTTEGPAESFTLRTRLAIKIRDQDATTVAVMIRFFDPEDSQVSQLFAQTPVAARLARDGRMVEIKLPAAVNAEDATRIANVLYSFQVILDRASAYETTETDANGTSQFRYQIDAGTLQKRRLRVTPAPNSTVATKVEASRVEAIPGDFWLASLQGNESLSVTGIADGSELASIQCEWSLQRIATPAGLALEWPDGALDDWVSATSPDRPESGEDMAKLRKRYAGVTVMAALSDLTDAVKRMADHADTLPEMEALADLLRAFPERAAELAVLLQDPSLPDGVRARAMHALELAGRTSPDAQAALAEILRHPESYSPEALSQAIVAAGGVGPLQGSALREALAKLATAHEDPFLSDAATLALGRLAETNADVRALITPALEAILGSAESSPEDVAMALWALRNGRITSESLRARAEELARHPDESLRTAAREYLATE